MAGEGKKVIEVEYDYSGDGVTDWGVANLYMDKDALKYHYLVPKKKVIPVKNEYVEFSPKGTKKDGMYLVASYGGMFSDLCLKRSAHKSCSGIAYYNYKGLTVDAGFEHLNPLLTRELYDAVGKKCGFYDGDKMKRPEFNGKEWEDRYSLASKIDSKKWEETKIKEYGDYIEKCMKGSGDLYEKVEKYLYKGDIRAFLQKLKERESSREGLFLPNNYLLFEKENGYPFMIGINCNKDNQVLILDKDGYNEDRGYGGAYFDLRGGLEDVVNNKKYDPAYEYIIERLSGARFLGQEILSDEGRYGEFKKAYNIILGRTNEMGEGIGDNAEIIVNVTYNRITEESAKDGDYAESGFDLEGQKLIGLEEVRSLNENYGFFEPSNTGVLRNSDWFTSGEHERVDGGVNVYNLHIESVNGEKPTVEDMYDIAGALGIELGYKLDRKGEKVIHGEEGPVGLECIKYDSVNSDNLKNILRDVTEVKLLETFEDGLYKSKYTGKSGSDVFVLERVKPYDAHAYTTDIWQFKSDFGKADAKEFIKQYDEREREKKEEREKDTVRERKGGRR